METPEITLKLDPRQLNVIGAGLQELPYRVAAEVIAEIQRQVSAQMPSKPEGA
jgi:hypothetical protein